MADDEATRLWRAVIIKLRVEENWRDLSTGSNPEILERRAALFSSISPFIWVLFLQLAVLNR